MKPLLISDCDEVLLHMVKHFGVWVREAHDIDFTPDKFLHEWLIPLSSTLMEID